MAFDFSAFQSQYKKLLADVGAGGFGDSDAVAGANALYVGLASRRARDAYPAAQRAEWENAADSILALIGKAKTATKPKPAQLSGPIEDPNWQQRISSPFSLARLLSGVVKPHKAVDIAVAAGTRVTSIKAGTVTYAGWNDGGYGNLVIILHDDGYESRYAHLSKVEVAVNDRVVGGQVIALSGNTGHSTGAHLHLEVRQPVRGGGRIPIDPLIYFRQGSLA